jgi:8-oxo-dGTP pyrophosphatase MutT (NUDIX family)
MNDPHNHEERNTSLLSEGMFDPWPVISSEVLFTHPNLTLVEDTLALPTGVQTRWLRFASTEPSVCAICVNERGHVLVAHQYNPAPGRLVHEFPGGRAASGEELGDAARRELLEEVGIYAHRVQAIGSFLVNNRRSAQKQHVFLATDCETRESEPDPEEIIGYEWLPVATIEQKIISGEFENNILLSAWSIFRLTCSHYFR